jgi:5-formyltetrahydrofolate cyclo-ligase
MNPVYEQKVILRKSIRKKLRTLDPETARLSAAAICKQVLDLPDYRNAKTVFAFVGVQWEIDTKDLLLLALSSGKRVAVPLCLVAGIMEARLIRSLNELVPGAYGIPEPTVKCPVCPPAEIDFAVIPCVSCDRACMRLGQGGGYYDRFLEHASFFNAAICRDIAILESVPVEPWDRPVDCVVTETTVYYRQNK